jgi:hypothetical protein
MGTVLKYRHWAREPRRPFSDGRDCEIVIFPGVRRERHDADEIDLAHRLTTTDGDFDGIGGGRSRRGTRRG